MNAKHREYEALCYRVIDTEIYIEDGDMEGFFVTYTRVPDCVPKPVAPQKPKSRR